MDNDKDDKDDKDEIAQQDEVAQQNEVAQQEKEKTKNTTIDPNFPGGPNCIRAFINYLQPLFKSYFMGHYYLFIHYTIMLAGAVVFLFTKNIFFLCVILFTLVLDTFCIAGLHNCPLTLLERNYLQVNYASSMKEALHRCNIVYNCDHAYESQIEYLINLWCFVVLKILGLMLMRTFHIQVV
jgi:hypothetical protein